MKYLTASVKNKIYNFGLILNDFLDYTKIRDKYVSKNFVNVLISSDKEVSQLYEKYEIESLLEISKSWRENNKKDIWIQLKIITRIIERQYLIKKVNKISNDSSIPMEGYCRYENRSKQYCV